MLAAKAGPMFCASGLQAASASARAMLKLGMSAAVLALRHGHEGQGWAMLLSEQAFDTEYS
jgi:hypothetical protein